MSRKPITVSIQENLVKALDKEAEASNLSRSRCLETILLRRYLEPESG